MKQYLSEDDNSLTNVFCKQVDWSRLHINNLKVIQKSVLQEIQKSFENAYDCTASRRCIGKVAGTSKLMLPGNQSGF